MQTPQIYVACLTSYNEGMLHGVWIDATDDVEDMYEQINNMLASSTAHSAGDWVIHDYSDFGNLTINEFESLETVAEYAQFIVDHGKLGIALLQDYDVNEAEKMLTDRFYGTYDNEVEFAEQLFDECYSNTIPDEILYYFDYSAFARDLFINDFIAVEADHRTYVFSNR